MILNTNYTRKLAVISLLSATSIILTFIQFCVPLFPVFLKFDFSVFPALIAALSIEPVSGIVVIFIKNLFSLFSSSTMGIGEISNFIIESVFVFTAGFIYGKNKTRKTAGLSLIIATMVMVFVSILVNYYIVLPLYSFIIPLDAIINMCRLINPFVDSLLEVVIIFILPFNLIKGLVISCITFILYKKLSIVIKNTDLKI